MTAASQVVSNCVVALDEILREEGGMAINKPIIHHLLNRIRDFNEWSQCVVMELVARYKPESADETFDVMNLLEERLKHSNSAVVLAAVKVFLNLTQDMPAVHSQVYTRLKAPMLTLMTGGNFEQGFTCLKHICLLTSRAPDVFASDFKHFYSRYNDPPCVKLLKLEILTAIATATNVGEVVEEVAEYVTDPDTGVARGAVASIGKMGVKVARPGSRHGPQPPAPTPNPRPHPPQPLLTTDPQVAECAPMIVETLIKFLEVDIEYVSAEAILAIGQLLRKYPAVSDPIIQGVGTFLRSVEEPAAKVVLLWMLAEYGHVIPEAPYLIEPFIDGFEEEGSQAVRLELLSAATRLFFRRPAEMQAMLGRLFEVAISDASFTDVHDRAMLYYRLLRFDVREADRVISASAHVEGSFVEEAASELQDRIFEEFNTLAVIYGEPSERFVTHECAKAAAAKGAAADRAGGPAAAVAEGDGGWEQEGAAAADLLGAEEEEGEEEDDDDSGAAAPPAAAPRPPPSPMDDLLGLMDDLPSAPPHGSAGTTAPSLALSPTASLDAATFQQQWAGLPVGEQWSVACGGDVADAITERLAAKHIKCMAFGNVGGNAKFYFYAQEVGGGLLLVELTISRAEGKADATAKGANMASVPLFTACLKAALG